MTPHDLLPHFETTDIDGARVAYSSIWQRRNLVLAILPDLSPRSRRYAERIIAEASRMQNNDIAWVVTRDPIDGFPCPGVVVADRWGEIAHVVQGTDVDDLPAPDELTEWVRYVQSRCPECEGEAK